MQTLGYSSQSLINGISRLIKARELNMRFAINNPCSNALNRIDTLDRRIVQKMVPDSVGNCLLFWPDGIPQEEVEMKTVRCVSFFLLSLAFAGLCSVAQSAPQQLTIPNIDPDSPACVVKVPDQNAQCTASGCTVGNANANADAANKVQIKFTCLPTSAPTGFERPASDMQVYPIKSVNSTGHLSLIDDMASSAGTPIQEVNFCLFGESNNFCGNAKIARTTRRARSGEVEAIKRFLKQIEFNSAGATQLPAHWPGRDDVVLDGWRLLETERGIAQPRQAPFLRLTTLTPFAITKFAARVKMT